MAGRFLPSVSLIGPLPLVPPSSSSLVQRPSSPSLKLQRKLDDRRCPCRNIEARSLSPSSSNSSPSAVSWSGGAIHSRGTTQGNATPMPAALLIHDGAALPVNCSHRYVVK